MQLRAKSRRVLGSVIDFMGLGRRPVPHLGLFELQPLERRVLLNASPQISGDSTVYEGSAYTLSLASNDSDGEGIAYWTVNWGDGNTDTLQGDPSSASHTYADASTGSPNYDQITASVTENGTGGGYGGYGGGYGSGYGGTFDANSVDVSVLPYPPSVSLSSGTTTPLAGVPFTLNVSTSYPSQDPDGDTVGSIYVDWGDNTNNTYYASDYGGTFPSPLSVQHTYASGGNYTISSTASDDDTTSSATTLGVSIGTPAAPIPFITGGYQVGSTAIYNLQLENLAANSTIDNWVISWGDGSAPLTITGNANSVTHQFIAPSISDMITAVAIQSGVSYPSNRLPIVVRPTSTTSDPPSTNIVVNFQPALSTTTPVTPGYVVDQGHAFSDQANWFLFNTDYCYGWDDNYSDAVASSGSSDPRANTYIPMQSGGVDRNWFIGLADGTYQVHIVSGYNSFVSGSRYQIDANGTQVLDGTPSSGNTWISGTATVSVTDGRLTVSNGAQAANNIIDYIEISPTAHLSQVPTAPSGLTAVAESDTIVNLNWIDNSDNESNFIVYRSTDGGTTYSALATLGMDVTQYSDTGLTAGTNYTYRIVASNSAGNSTNSNAVTAQTLRLVGGRLLEAPYGGTAWPVPGRIEAENFDTGGSGVGYSDEDSINLGGQYRHTGVDIGGAGPTSTGWMVGWTTASGAYMNYTVNVLSTGYYRLDASVASDGPGGTFHVEVDGTNVTGSMTVPDTGGWLTFNTISSEGTQSPPSGIYLTQGTHILKLSIDSPGSHTGAVGNFDWLQFASMSVAVPIAPTNLKAAPLSSGQVLLSWQDFTSNATGYTVQRSNDGGVTFATVTSSLPSTATSFTDTTASAGTVYIYRVEASNSQGASYPSNAVTILTSDSSAVAINPAADTYVDAANPTSTEGTSATLDAQKVSDGSQDKHIYLRFDTSSITGTIDDAELRLFGMLSGASREGVTLSVYGVSSASTTWSDSSSFSWNSAPAASGAALSTETCSDSTGQWYQFDVGSFITQQISAGHRIVTLEIVVAGNNSDAWQFTSKEGGVTQPVLLVHRSSSTSTPSLSASPISTSQINLSWTFNGTADGYYLERSTDGFTFSQITDTASLSYSDTGLTAGTAYWYRVRAHGSPYGESPYSNIVATGTTAPTPFNLSATAISGYQVNLSWTNGAGNQGGIDIERSTDDVNFTQIGTTTGSATNYSDTTASASTTYYYRIRAYGPGPSSPYTSAVSVTTLAGPNPASNLTAVVTTSTTVHTVALTWADNSTNETGFQVQRSSTSATGGFTTLTTTGANVTTYTDTTGTDGSVYWYRIVSVQNSAAGGPSNVVKTALPEVSAVTSTEGASFSGTVAYFTDSTGAATDYTATIIWGDGSNSAATITADPNNAGRLLIGGSHTYSDDGNYTLAVALIHTADRVNSNTTETAAIADAALSISPATVNPSTGAPFSGPVATFTDANSNGKLGDYTATIDWQDGRGPKAASVQTAIGGGFEVIGTHTWTNAGSSSFIVTVKDIGGSQASTTVITGPATTAAPGALTAHADWTTPASQIDLSWYDAVGTQSGIYIERSTDDVTFTQIANLTGTPTTYQDSGLSASTTYYYRIRSYGNSGDSAYVGPVSATTAASNTQATPTLQINGGDYVQDGQKLPLSVVAKPAVYVDPSSYIWSVTSNGATYDTGCGSTYIFAPNQSGTYTVNVSLQASGSTVSASENVTVAAVPPQHVSINGPAVGQTDHELTFTSSANAAPGTSRSLSYQWSVTLDGANLNLASPDAITDLNGFRFMPTVTGQYIVSLNLIGGDGAVATAHQSVDVIGGKPLTANWTQLAYATTFTGVLTNVETGENVIDLGNDKLLVVGNVNGSVFVSRVDVATNTMSLDTTFGDFASGTSGGRIGSTLTPLTMATQSTANMPSEYDVHPGVAIQSDGKIVIAAAVYDGDIYRSVPAVARLNADGTIDTTFGMTDPINPQQKLGYTYLTASNFVNTPFYGGRFAAVSIDSDGKIVAAGLMKSVDVTDFDFAEGGQSLTARFNADGSLDDGGSNDSTPGDSYGDPSSDGTHGMGTAHFQLINEAYPYTQTIGGKNYNGTAYLDESLISLVPISGGRFMAGAWTSVLWTGGDGSPWTNRRFTLVGIKADGTLDTSFGTNGMVITPLTSPDGHPFSDEILGNLLVESNGDFVAIGSQGSLDAGAQMAVVEYTPSGQLDTSFNGTGMELIPTNSTKQDSNHGDYSTFATGGLDANGDIVIAGGDSLTYSVIARLSSNGMLDPNFGNDGTNPINWDDGSGNLTTTTTHGIAVDPDGTVFVTGSVSQGVGVARYEAPVNAANNLVATASADGSVELNWQDGGGSEDGFVISRKVDQSTGDYQTIGYVGPNTTVFNDSTVNPSTTYDYRVAAYWVTYDDHQNPVYTEQSGPPTTSVKTGDPNSAWQWVETDSVPVNGSTVQSTIQLKAGAQYMLVASGYVALDTSGQLHADAQYGLYNPAPSALAPAGWYGGAVAYGIAVDPAASMGLTRFPYWGSPATDPNHTYSFIYTPSQDENVKFDFQDNYYPDNSADSSKYAGAVPFTVQIFQQIPTPPTALTATADRNSNQVVLNWTNSPAIGQQQIQIERSVNGGDFSYLASVPAGLTSYTDTGLSLNTRYSYRITTNTTSGASNYSNEANVLMDNEAPVFQVTPKQMADSTGHFNDFYVTATDPDPGDTVTYSVEYDYDGAISIDQNTGKISSNPDPQDGLPGPPDTWSASDGPYPRPVVVTATDSHGATSQQVVNIYVPVQGQTVPTITPVPTILSSNLTSATLKVAASEGSSGDANLTYSWRVVSMPNPLIPPQFSINDLHGAGTTTVTFGAPGIYVFNAYANDPLGLFAASNNVTITVTQTPVGLAVIPDGMTIMPGGHWTYDAIEIDQFGNPMGSPLTSGVTWSVKSTTDSMAGTFTGSTYNAPTSTNISGGVDTLLASYADAGFGVTVTGTATIGIQTGNNAAPVVETSPGPTAIVGGPSNLSGLSGLIAVSLSALGGDDAGEANLKYTWSCTDFPQNATVTFLPSTLNGTNGAKNLVAGVSEGGSYTFAVTVTDSGGLTATDTLQPIDVPNANASRVPTSIAIAPELQSVGTGGTQSFTATVLDQYGQPIAYDLAGSFNWTVDGGTVTKAAVDSSDPIEQDKATFNAPATANDYTISVSYTGISQAATTSVSVVAPAPPMVKLTSPTDSGPWSITTDTDVDAMVIDPMGGQPTWTLTATPLSGGGSPITLAQGKGSEGFMPFHGWTLATLHPLLLGSGSFMLTLTAQNSDGVSTDSHEIQVSVPAQGGGMTLPVVDMSIPTGGLPIVISRMYDSSQASQNGDLGYGWRLELPDVHLTSTAVERNDISDDPAHPAYTDGDIVSVILPGGDIERFQFTPQQDGSAYVPAFSALNGSTDTLAAWTATDTNGNPLDANGNLILLDKGSANEYYEPNGNAVTGYNPTLSQFGNTFTLTTTNGTVYKINATTGMVSTVADRNGNVLDYSHFFDASNPRIISTSASGQSTSVTITRAGNGHITAITDPQNNSIHYGYDVAGELTSFTDRATVTVGTVATAVVTHYGYGDSNLPHFLTSVTDPRGVQVLTAAYDDSSGALTSLTDAFGKAAGATAGPQGTTSTSQSATDLTGSNNAQFTDDFGNVTRQIQSILDDNGNVIGYQVMQTDYAYQDIDGDLLSVTQWVPFNVPAPDPTGLRFHQKPTTIAQVTAYYTVKPTPQYQTDLYLPETVTVYGPNNTARVTTYSDYVDGKPQNSSQVLETLNLDGSVHSSVPVSSPSTTPDGKGNITSSTDALGNITGYSYDDSGHQTSSYRVIGGTTVTLTLSTYYGSTDANTGAVAGMLATNIDANGKKTFYSYTPNGDVAASWSLSGNGQWVVDETFYDADDRQISTTQAIYGDASPTQTLNTSGFTNGYPTITETVVQAPVTQSQTGYNLIGQTDWTADAYDTQSNPHRTRYTYDAHGNVIRTLYPDGTEQRTVYDSMNRVIWQTDAYATTTTYNSDGTYTNDNTTTANATFTIYDSQGRVIGTQRYSGALISVGSITVAGGVGLPTTSLTTQGTLISTTATYYDAEGRVVETDSASGLRTGTIYYPTGQVQYTGILLASAQFGGPFTTADFDPASAYTESKYDLVGGTMPTSAIYYNASIQHVYENGSWSTHETDTYFDAGGHVIQTSYPDGSFTQTLYSLYGQPIASTTLSSLGITPPNSTTEGWPGVPAGGQEVVKIGQRKTGDPAVATFYLYDVAGNLLDVWQPAVNVPYASVVENDHPAGYWRLGEMSGSVASDSSANNDNGTDSSVTLGQSGALTGDSDTAASFNGSSSNVSIPDSASLDITSHLTLECWINYSMANGGTGAPGILTKDDGYVVRGYGLYAGYTANQHIEFALNVGGSPVALTTQGSYNDGHWHYVVATYDGSAMRIYVDGSLVASNTVSGAIETNADPVMIGSFDQANADSHFQGSIDEAAVYNYALSASQIADHYAAAAGTMERPHWQYTYDHDGNQLTQVDPQGNVTSFTYDALGRELSRTLPDGQTGGSNAGHETETFTYDQYGNQVGHVDFNGNTTVNTYYTTGVHAGLIQEADYYKYPHIPSVNSPDETVIYGYDSLNRQASVNDSANGSTPTTYTYDPVTQNVASITSPEGVINYVYNPATGQEVRMIASHSGTVTDETDYAYDQQGRLIDVYGVVVQGTVYASFAGLDSNGNPTFTGGTPLTTAYTYDPLGNLASETDSDNTQTSYTYDVDNHLTALATVNTATGKPLFAESYDLDDNGLRKDVIDTRYNTDGSIFSQTKIAWTYDNDQRLANETLTVLAGGSNAPSPYSDTFKYDLSNNRTEEDVAGSATATVAYTYNGDDQLKTETRTGDGAYAITYGYDNNGSLISQVKTGAGAETDSYTYDARNRMISATVNGVTTTYTYDDNGVRVSETTNGVTTYYLNDPRNPTGYTKAIEESTTLNGTPTRAYVIGKQIIAQKDVPHGLLYLVHDDHGSTRILLDASTYVVEQYNYDAYGNLLVSAGAQSNASAAMTEWLFAGDGSYDAGSTWTYQLSRFRDDFHFTQMDSYMGRITDPMSLQKYVYDASNPTNAFDPTGHMALAMGLPGLLVVVALMMVLMAMEFTSLHTHLSFNFSLPTFSTTAAVTATTTVVALTSEEIAQNIANGHAGNSVDDIDYPGHLEEFEDLGVYDRDTFADVIEDVIDNADEQKKLLGNRTAYVDWENDIIVINDPNNADKGTAFRPPYSIDNPKPTKEYWDRDLK